MPAAQVMCAGSSRANAGHLEQRSPGSLNAQHIDDVDDMVADGACIVNPWVTHHLHGQHMLSHLAMACRAPAMRAVTRQSCLSNTEAGASGGEQRCHADA